MTSAYALVPLRNGRLGIRSAAFGEICHPGVGPEEEAETLYVKGLDLRRRLASASGEFVVWDVGLGGGANAAAVIRAARTLSCSLAVISFDRQLDQLNFALRHAAELGYWGDLAPLAERLLHQGALDVLLGQARVRWSRVVADFPAWLAHRRPPQIPPPHVILHDPHSPAANPEMWTLPFFRDLRASLDPDRPCALSTYSRATAVRTALLLAGFHVGSGGGTATKEETTVAATHPELLASLLGSRWLERARRSRAAEPWTHPPFGGRPLSPESWARLQSHPQFAGQGTG